MHNPRFNIASMLSILAGEAQPVSRRTAGPPRVSDDFQVLRRGKDRRVMDGRHDPRVAKPAKVRQGVDEFLREFLNGAAQESQKAGASVNADTAQEKPAAAPPTPQAQSPAFKVGDRIEPTYNHAQWSEGIVTQVEANGPVHYTIKISTAYGEIGECTYDNPCALRLLPQPSAQAAEAKSPWIDCGPDMPDLKAGEFEARKRVTHGGSGKAGGTTKVSLCRLIGQNDFTAWQYRDIRPKQAAKTAPAVEGELVPGVDRVYFGKDELGRDVFSKWDGEHWCLRVLAGDRKAAAVAKGFTNRAYGPFTIIRPASEAELRGEA